jgi:hypothetical protein
MTLTRRILLTLTGLAVLGIAIPACRKMLAQILFSPKAPQVPPPPLLGNPFKNGSRSLVAMVQRAIELIGGLGKLELTGTRTLLKPNVIGGGAPPITTDPRVVQALGALVQAERPASVVVGEMSAVMSLPTRSHLEGRTMGRRGGVNAGHYRQW